MDLEYPRKDGSTLAEHLQQHEKVSGERDSMFDRAIPPIYCDTIWRQYWYIRTDGVFKASEAYAYANLPGEEIGRFELHEMYIIDSYVNNRLEYHRKAQKS